MKDIELARAIFNAWDAESKGYLSLQELTEQCVCLGLALDSSFVENLLRVIKAKYNRSNNSKVEPKPGEIQTVKEPDVGIELMTLKDFLKVFEFSKFLDASCAMITKEFHFKLTLQKRKKDRADKKKAEVQKAAFAAMISFKS